MTHKWADIRREPKTLGAKVKELRQARGMTLRYLASQIGVSYQFLQMLEAGRKSGTNKLPELARVLGVDVSVFGVPEGEEQ